MAEPFKNLRELLTALCDGKTVVCSEQCSNVQWRGRKVRLPDLLLRLMRIDQLSGPDVFGWTDPDDWSVDESGRPVE